MTGVTTVPELDAQYRAMREAAGVLDRSARGKLEVHGPDAREFLQGQLTNEIEKLDPERGCYAALLDRKGHVQSDMRVLHLGTGELWLDTEAEAFAGVLRHLSTYKVGREVDVTDVSSEWAITSLIGPASAAIAGGPTPRPEHAQSRF